MRQWSRHLGGERPDLVAGGPILAKGPGESLDSPPKGRAVQHILRAA